MVEVSAWRLARHRASLAQETFGERVVRIPMINATLGKLRFAGWWLVYHRGLQRFGASVFARVKTLAAGRLSVSESLAYARSRTRA